MTRFAPLGLHRCRLIMAAVVGSWLMADVRPALAQSGASPFPSFDFRQAGAVAGWGDPHDVSHIEATKLGMAVHIDGPDPYILQTYPQDHPHHGLLPDSFNLSAQLRNPADINPGTLQPLALWLLAGDRPAAIPYKFHALRSSGLWVHAPGAVEAIRDQPGSAHFTVKAWSPRPSFVVIHGLHRRPASKALPVVRLDGQPIALDPPHQYLPDRGTLILEVKGGKPVAVEVEIDH